MTEKQWNNLIKTISGKKSDRLPIGFIIDSPWLPKWYGIKMIDYFTNDDLWFNANMKVCKQFPDIIFLPGFWSEYGMCTEPSAFGARCTFFQNQFPHAHPVIKNSTDIDHLTEPDPSTDGLLPFMLNRLKIKQKEIEANGHFIKFSVSRGPLNIASYLMGTTQFLTLIMTEPAKAHTLLRKISNFLIKWHKIQIDTFSSIDGILLLDDIIGFVGETEFKEFGLPYFKQIYDFDVRVKFLHNDASSEASAPFLTEMGVNLFNMGFETDLNQLKQITHNKVTMLGNIPPRDVLAKGSPEDVQKAKQNLVNNLDDTNHIILSCGGGMPPDVSTENMKAFCR